MHGRSFYSCLLVAPSTQPYALSSIARSVSSSLRFSRRSLFLQHVSTRSSLIIQQVSPPSSIESLLPHPASALPPSVSAPFCVRQCLSYSINRSFLFGIIAPSCSSSLTPSPTARRSFLETLIAPSPPLRSHLPPQTDVASTSAASQQVMGCIIARGPPCHLPCPCAAYPPRSNTDRKERPRGRCDGPVLALPIMTALIERIVCSAAIRGAEISMKQSVLV